MIRLFLLCNPEIRFNIKNRQFTPPLLQCNQFLHNRVKFHTIHVYQIPLFELRVINKLIDFQGSSSARNGPVYMSVYHTGTLLVHELHTVTYQCKLYLSVFVFLIAYACFAFKKHNGTSKFPFRAR